MRIAIQGEVGSFHHQAAVQWFGNDVSLFSADTFTEAFAALDSNNADMALVAIENSLYGSINEVLDLIERHRYPIIGEIYLRIQQQLITLPGATTADIKQIYSHPVALAQCQEYLHAHFKNVIQIEYPDTAGSVELIKEKNDPSLAAIAGRIAASNHGLPILAEDIEDNKANFTRFVIIDPNGTPSQSANKSSLVLTSSHTPGSLAHILSIFARAGVNLTKLQSRPIIGDAWKYRFYIDVEVAGAKLHELLAQIRATGAVIDVIGEYVTGKTY